MTTFPAEAFLRDALTVPVTEYSSASVTKKNGQAKKTASRDIRFSFFRLSVAAAKSILTRAPLSVDMWKEVRACYYVLDSMIEHASLNLRMTSGFRQKYRDFSKTSRTGELAQALTFILAQDVIGYPIVCDFSGFLQSQALPAMKADEQTPDYALLFKNGASQLSLIESKGSCPDVNALRPKGPLREALTQCKSANDHIFASAAYNAKNSYGTHVRLAESTDGWETVIGYCDPEEPTRDGPTDPLNVLRRYYAAWFVLAGYPRYASMLADGTLSEEAVSSWTPIDESGFISPGERPDFDMFTPFQSFRRPRDNPTIPKTWAMSGGIIQALIREDVPALRDLLGLEVEARTDLQTATVYFRDQTLCRWK
jgi:hypothetical protein